MHPERSTPELAAGGCQVWVGGETRRMDRGDRIWESSAQFGLKDLYRWLSVRDLSRNPAHRQRLGAAANFASARSLDLCRRAPRRAYDG